MANIRKRPLAEADLDDLWDRIAEDSPDRADDFLRKLGKKLEILATQPYMGYARNELIPGLRSFPYKNYVFFYFPIENGIDVVRVLRGSMDIPNVFSEMDSE
jgi:toxin ParE1/3/4